MPPGLRALRPDSAACAATSAPMPARLPAGASMQDQVLFTMMQTQTALLDRLGGRRAEGVDTINHILSGAGDEHGNDAGLRLPGAKGAAAREAFRTEVRQRPLNVARTIYGNVSGAMAWEPIAGAGMAGKASMRAYMTQRVAFGSYRTLAYLGFSIATAWDWLMEGDAESLDHVKALLGLTCAAIEQVTIDGGAWTLAQHHMCLPEPPWAYISRSTTGQPRVPFTELADARWSAALMGYLRDVESLKTQRKAPDGAREDAPLPKKPAKGDGKKGGGRGSGGAAAADPQ